MFHPVEIKYMSDEAARKAAAKGRKPYVFFDERDVSQCPPFPFPFLGDFCPVGWGQLLDEDLFIDTTGYGVPGEPALTIDELKAKILTLLRTHPDDTLGFAISERGQFQAHLRVYRRGKA